MLSVQQVWLWLSLVAKLRKMDLCSDVIPTLSSLFLVEVLLPKAISVEVVPTVALH